MPPVETVRPNGPAIRKLRYQHGLTLAQLGRKIGRHGQAIRKLEAGEGLASLIFIHQLARALKVDVSELVLPEDSEDENGAAA